MHLVYESKWANKSLHPTVNRYSLHTLFSSPSVSGFSRLIHRRLSYTLDKIIIIAMKTMIVLTMILFANGLIAENKKTEDYTVKITSEMKGDAVTFTIKAPQIPKWNSYPKNFRFEHISQAYIVGDNIRIPMGNAGSVMSVKKAIKFTLPKTMLKRLSLKLWILNPTQGNKTKLRTIDLMKLSESEKE